MEKKLNKVFIGFDPIESVAWHTMAHSVLRQSTIPLALIPVNLKNLKSLYWRETDYRQSNEFSFSRFLVPYLSDYEGYSLFFDCDMLVRTDIRELFKAAQDNPDMAVHVVKHDYEPRTEVKYLNNLQYKYPRKNWSSVVVWNCAHPSNRVVTPEYVNSASPTDLHRFNWLEDKHIGELNIRWNWLVGEYEDPPSDVKNVHWTIGGPYFNEYRNADFSEEWFTEHKRINYCAQIKEG